MFVIVNLEINLSDYSKLDGFIPVPFGPACSHCKNCNRSDFHRHGYYDRNIIEREIVYSIRIPRLLCLKCRRTISILPDFILPYFQHSLKEVLKRVDCLLKKEKTNGSRQLNAKLLKRFLGNLKWIHSYFVHAGLASSFSEEKIENAKKYLKMIRDFGESLFLRKSTGHLSMYFLAK